jgi:K+-transporting ATPase ATPase A chain
VGVTAGTLRTSSPLFGGFVTGTLVIVIGLEYVPMLALGPVLEQLRM